MVQEASLFMKNMQRITWILGFSERDMICFQRGLQIGELWNTDTYASTLCQLDVRTNTGIWVLKHLITNEQDDSGVLIKDIVCRCRESSRPAENFLRSLLESSQLAVASSLHQRLSICQSVLCSRLPLQWPQELTFKNEVTEENAMLPVYSREHQLQDGPSPGSHTFKGNCSPSSRCFNSQQPLAGHFRVPAFSMLEP